MELKSKILRFEIKEWFDMSRYDREAYRNEVFEMLRDAGWYICEAERTVYTITDMNQHIKKVQKLIRKHDKYDWGM